MTASLCLSRAKKARGVNAHCCRSGFLLVTCGGRLTRRGDGRCARGGLLSLLPGAADVFLSSAVGFGGELVARRTLLATDMRNAGQCKKSRSDLTVKLSHKQADTTERVQRNTGAVGEHSAHPDGDSVKQRQRDGGGRIKSWKNKRAQTHGNSWDRYLPGGGLGSGVLRVGLAGPGRLFARLHPLFFIGTIPRLLNFRD
jgi:hypothetical protein